MGFIKNEAEAELPPCLPALRPGGNPIQPGASGVNVLPDFPSMVHTPGPLEDPIESGQFQAFKVSLLPALEDIVNVPVGHGQPICGVPKVQLLPVELAPFG